MSWKGLKHHNKWLSRKGQPFIGGIVSHGSILSLRANGNVHGNLLAAAQRLLRHFIPRNDVVFVILDVEKNLCAKAARSLQPAAVRDDDSQRTLSFRTNVRNLKV